ncbi:MAG: oligosaccharide repeat unit polymerase family protein [Methanobrevibacter sp.]|nr:oligosaccharide repeat unit polymerase family protein [Methanobrevibacter sp.]
MSILYSIAGTISKFFENLFKKSFLFTTIFGILRWIENQWVNSYFKGLYPNEEFFNLFKKSKILSKHIFSPLIVILVFSVFLILSLRPVSFSLVINIAIAFIAFIIGAIIIPRFFINNKNSSIKDENSLTNDENTQIDNDIRGEDGPIVDDSWMDKIADLEEEIMQQKDEKEPLKNENRSIKNKNNPIKNKINLIKFNSYTIYSIGFCLVLIGIIFFFLSVASVGGLPILNPPIRYDLKPILTMPVFLMIPGIGLMSSYYLDRFKKGIISRSQIRFRFLLLTIISGLFLLTLGYRTPILAAFLMMIIIAYYGEILAVWEVIIGALLGVTMIIGIGYYRSIEEFAITASTSPFYTLQSRADFTLNVLNLLNHISGDFGLMHGRLTLSAIPGAGGFGPRTIIGQLIAWRTGVTLTPTLIGPMLIDFGRVGLAIFMGLLGFILGIAYKILEKTTDSFYIALYALLLSYAIIGIETGILDIQVLVYFFIGFFIYIANILRNRKNISK